jgi:GxxExxY protein
MNPHPNQFTKEVIGAAIEVHRALGPGLLESAYQHCLARELDVRSIPFQREVWIGIDYKGIIIERAYRLDFLVGSLVVVELKAVDCLTPIDDAQLLTYLRLGGWPVGLLINFNVPILKEGIRRRVLNLAE